MRLSTKLLKWYDRHRRDLPWRAPPGVRPDPYRVWLSEIMLQQTTVPTVVPYFRAFLARWPTVADLAAADLDDVLAAWAGLGYYARARNLHECARTVVAAGGRFPETESGLRALPGIGPYTAGAIAAIAFGVPVAAVDGNAERVITRFYGIEDPLPDAKARVRDLNQKLVPGNRPGDFVQALMDLGATVCTPGRPACDRCPWGGRLYRETERDRRGSAAQGPPARSSAAACNGFLGGRRGRARSAASAPAVGIARGHDGGSFDSLDGPALDGGHGTRARAPARALEAHTGRRDPRLYPFPDRVSPALRPCGAAA